MTVAFRAILGAAGRDTGGGGGGAGISVEGTAKHNYGFVTSTHTIPLPSGITPGDLLVLVLKTAIGIAPTTPTGWTALAVEAATAADALYYRVADGSEGSSVDVSIGSSVRAAAITYRIAGAAVLEANFIEGTLQASFLGVAPYTAPMVTPTWGEAESLWLTGVSSRATNRVFTAPTDYTNQIDEISGAVSSGTGYVSVSTAQRIVASASQTPTSWGCSPNANAGRIFTLAIRPA